MTDGMIDDIDRAILNALQGGFPLTERPFADAAQDLGLTEADLIGRIGAMLDGGVASRFGPMFDAERMGGAFCLCAMAVPHERFEEVAVLVDAHPEVAHNYERRHALNMWFVLATGTPERIGAVLDDIERETGLAVLAFPKLREFFIGLRIAA